MVIICLCVLVISSVVNVICCAKGNRKYRIISKVFIVPSILCIYLLMANKVRLTVVFALAFGWMGDIFLVIPTKTIFKLMGVAAFTLGHIFYIISFHYGLIHIADKWLYGIIPLTAILLVAVGVSFVWKYIPVNKRTISICYYLLLAAVVTGGLLVVVSQSFNNCAIAIGAMFFAGSDILISKQYFNRNASHNWEDTVVMSTYILAQGFLTLGFIGLN